MNRAINRMTTRRPTGAAVLMARLVNRHGVLLGRGALRSIYFIAVTGEGEGGAARPIAYAAVEPNEVVLDELRNDSGWTVDAIGYNFCHRFEWNSLNLPRDAAGCEIRYVVQDMNGETSIVCFRMGRLNHD